MLVGCDIVYDEGKQYAQKLRGAGNKVYVRIYPGACHGHMMLALEAPSDGLTYQFGLDAIQDLCTRLKQLFDHA